MASTISPERIAEILLIESPGWARAALTAPSTKLRTQAADALANLVYRHLEEPSRTVDANQLALPLA